MEKGCIKSFTLSSDDPGTGQVWQYRMRSFQMRDTKLGIILEKKNEKLKKYAPKFVFFNEKSQKASDDF